MTLRPEQVALLRQLQDPYVATCTLMRNSPQLLAESTFLNIRRAMLQLTRWAYAEKRDPWEEGTVVRWLRQKDILPSTKDTYLKNFLQVRTWSLATPLQQYKNELLRDGANMPTYQAPPCLPETLDFPGLADNHHQLMQIWLAWKTASRWSDLLRLTTKDFIVLDHQTLIVDWSNKTKASLRRPFRASRYAVIKGSRTKMLVAWVQTLRDPIQWMSTAEVAQRLKRASPNLTAHSLKVGATQVLEWAVAEGKLSHELKTRLLKHDPRDASLEMSLRYGRDRVAQALSLHTYKATRLL